MRRWQPIPTINRWISVLLLIVAIAATSYTGIQLSQVFAAPAADWPINLRLYGEIVLFLALVGASAALAYRVAAAFTLSYDLDRNGLYINWLGNRAVVPLDQISHVDIGLGDAASGWNPLSAIGYFSGQRKAANSQIIHRFATLPNDRALVIHTADERYTISPSDTEAFVQDLEQRRNLGSAKALSATVEPGRMFLYAFWHDATVRGLLLVALAINLLVLGILAARYPTLGQTIEMRFNAIGNAAGLRPRYDVLFLPLAAALLSLINTSLGLLLYRVQPIVARMLQGASVVVQILFGIAILTIIR